MKKTILRILTTAGLLSFAAAIVVTIIGLILKWKTFAQFSDGFFWAGAILIMVGVIFVMGNINQPPPGLAYSQAGGQVLTVAERTRIWASDITRGYNIMGFLGTSGLLLFGLSYLVSLIGS